jgi:hypothetical protein
MLGRKSLLRAGAVALALTFAVVTIPATPALADSGGGCSRDLHTLDQVCISVWAGTQDPLRGDGYSGPGTIEVHGAIYLAQWCDDTGFSDQYGPLWWYITPNSHSPVITKPHISCNPGHGHAGTDIVYYDANWHYYRDQASNAQYF